MDTTYPQGQIFKYGKDCLNSPWISEKIMAEFSKE